MRRVATILLLFAAAAVAQERPDLAQAQMLAQRGDDFSAFYLYARILEAGPSDPSFLTAVEAIAAISEAARDEVFGPNLLARVSAADREKLPPAARARVNAALGLLAYRAGHLDEAERLVTAVPAGAPGYPQAQYVLGLLQQRKDPARALGTFRGVLALEAATAGLKELSWLAIGRTLYGLHRYAEAVDAYGRLPRFSRHWDEALFEGAYADLRNGDPGSALGKLHSLHSPHLRDEFVPESVQLEALIYHERCLYDRVRGALERFTREYVPMREQIRKVLASDAAPEAYFAMMQSEDARLPEAVRHHLAKNERVAAMAAYIARLDGEAQRVRSDRELEPMRAALLERLADQKALTAQVAGKFIRGRLADMASLIEVLEGDRAIAAFETTKGEKDDLEANFDPRAQLALQTLRRPVMPPSGHEYWSFDGEYWPDEIGYYKVTLKDACREGPAQAAADPRSEAERAAAADRKRDELIAELQAILPRVPESGRKADLWFQLAELWWEKARFVSLQEGKQYDDAYAAWSKSHAGDEPKLDAHRSEGFRRQALDVYQRVLEGYPQYDRRDEVLFVVADNLQASGNKAEAAKYYRALIREFPSSRYVPDAYVQVGEFAFASNDLAHARDAFEKAASYRIPKLYAFALYKLAWCDYNAGDYAGAVAKFKEVIDYAENTSTANDRIQLRNEALKDVVLPFERLDDVDGASAYLEAKGGAEHGVDAVERLAGAFFEAGKFDRAVRVYRKLQADAPVHPHAAAWQQKVLTACDKLDRRDEVVVEMKRLVSDYGPQSAWAKAQRKAAQNDAQDASQAALRELVQAYHQEAIKTKDAATYRLARDIYRQYLDTYPHGDDAVAMRFYYAEILWSLEEWDGAAEQYGRVADEDPKGAYAAKAAYDAILALEKSVAIARGTLQKRELADAEKIDEHKAKGEVDATRRIRVQAVSKDSGEEAIPENEQKLIAACERYLAIAPGSKDEIAIRYRAAFISYEHRHFVDAAKRFGEIILRWPTDEMSRKAADLSLDILNTKEEWLALSELADRFLQNEKLCPPGSKFAADVARIGAGAQFKHIIRIYEEQKDFVAAAKEFRAFVARYPKSEHAPKALWNAMAIAERAEQLDVVIEAGEQLMRDYGRSDAEVVKLAVPALASACERTARYRDAIRWYEEAQKRWPADDRAADWLYNAAVWREGLGDAAGALQDFRKYAKQYGGRPDAAKVAFNVGRILEEQKRWRNAAEFWSSFGKDWSREATAGQLFLARYRHALALKALGSAAAGAFAEVARGYGKLPAAQRPPEVIDAAAHARLLAAEPAFKDFMEVRFRSSRQADLVATLRLKNQRLTKLLAEYREAIAIGSPQWSEAAFERIGEAYRNFNKGLLEAPVPRGLDAEQREMYRSTLEQQALPLEDKATDAFRRAIEVAQKSGVYTPWLIKAQDFLREYQPDAYGEVHPPILAATDAGEGD